MEKTNKQHWANLLRQTHGDNVSSIDLPAPDGTPNSDNDRRTHADTWLEEFVALAEREPENTVKIDIDGATLYGYNFDLDGAPVSYICIDHDYIEPEGCCLLDDHIESKHDLINAWLGDTTLAEHGANSAIAEFARAVGHDREDREMKIADEQFDAKLAEILSGMTGDQLLSVPGIYEIVAEEFNNEVIDAIEREEYE